jgi:hypothetical protein
MTSTFPEPLAADAMVVVDRSEWSLFVRPVETSGHAVLLWRQASARWLRIPVMKCGRMSAMIIGSLGVRRRMTARCGSNWDFGDSVFRALAARPRLRATVTLDKRAVRIMRVRFRGK